VDEPAGLVVAVIELVAPGICARGYGSDGVVFELEPVAVGAGNLRDPALIAAGGGSMIAIYGLCRVHSFLVGSHGTHINAIEQLHRITYVLE